MTSRVPEASRLLLNSNDHDDRFAAWRLFRQRQKEHWSALLTRSSDARMSFRFHSSSVSSGRTVTNRSLVQGR
jgi:hypothetical protein